MKVLFNNIAGMAQTFGAKKSSQKSNNGNRKIPQGAEYGSRINRDSFEFSSPQKENRDTAEKLFKDNLKPTMNYAKRIAKKKPEISKDDIIQAAMLGLTEAAVLNSPEPEETFAKYAKKLVRAEVGELVKQSNDSSANTPFHRIDQHYSKS